MRRERPIRQSGRGDHLKEAWGGRPSLSVLGRGDFNGDGIEDLMISSFAWIDGASYFSVARSIISRDAPGAPMRVLERAPVMGPGIEPWPMKLEGEVRCS